jgi:hypothetical protein
MAAIRNKPTDLGYQFGEHLARFADQEERRYQGSGLAVPRRCNTCAFRKGTYANGCEATLWDAHQCVIDPKSQFLCHEHTASQKPPVCAGWMLLHRTAGEDQEQPSREPDPA